MSTVNCRHQSERVREAAAWVCDRARWVRIEQEAIAAYAAGLPAAEPLPPDPEVELLEGDREARAAFVICLDAINFGSGWWPTIRKRPGRSGYFTVAAALVERFRVAGPWAAAELAAIDPATIAAFLEQDPGHPLMADFAAALRDVGTRVEAEHSGSFAAVLDAPGGSALALVDLLAGWASFADVSSYEGREVPFFKRAQIAAADAARAGLADLRELDRLTAFADNLVPHVLRVDGVLSLAPALATRIEAGELLAHGSPEEVELRAAAVQAVESLAAARTAAGSPLIPADVDAALWNRGRARRYKDVPRPRSRNTAY